MEYLLIGFGIFAILLVLLMAFFTYLANRYYRQLRNKKSRNILDASPYRRNKAGPVRPNNDFRAFGKVKKEKEASQELEKYDPRGLVVEQEREHNLVVDIAKPVGIWTEFITKQKLGFILAMMELQRKGIKGGWVMRINAQAMSQGKDKGKGR